MLNLFLEPAIQKKIQLYQVLQASKSISIKEISDVVKTDIAGVGYLIDELNNAFHSMAIVEKSQQMVSFAIYESVNPNQLLHALYADSYILACLKFMLMNDSGLPFTEFIDNNFVSKSTAYRARKSCQEYLKTIGLDIQKNKVVGEEYRIRFLIALLYYKFGVDCCGIDSESVQLARRFILSTNQAIDMDFLDRTENEYGYFECLLILLWKRKNYPVDIPQSNEFTQLKKIFIYQGIQEHLHNTIEKELGIVFSREEYDYIFAAYCCTNSCVMADKWQDSDIQLVYEIIFNHSVFRDLIQRLGCRFGIDVESNHAMSVALIYFSKKFILELQCIIPDKHFYLDSMRNPSTLKVIRVLNEILYSWHKANQFHYPIDPNHICCLSNQIETILRQYTPPIQLIVVSDLIIENEIMELALTKRFSEKQIQVTRFLLNAQKMDFLYNLSNCIIIVNHRLANYIGRLALIENNTIISISAEINSYDMKAIQEAIEVYQESSFLKTMDAIEENQNDRNFVFRRA